MTLRLNGSTSGYSEIDAPAVAGDQTFTLPGTGGTLDRLNRAGNILQVVSATKTDIFSSSSTSFVDITGLAVDITPSSALSKILVFTSLIADQSSTEYPMFKLLRDSLDVLVGDAEGSRIQVTFGTSAAAGNRPQTASYTAYDSPNTANQITYKIQGRVNAGTFFVNRSSNDTNGTGHFRAAATITVMEVAA
jgi:hypothetical protein